MRFSVVIPVYNGQRFIREALDSVLNQTRTVDEVVVYDDCSTDSSIELCQSYGDSITLVRGVDGPSGFVNAWNKALAFVSAEYISILHQDDFLYPDFFSNIEAALVRYPEVRHFFSVCDYVDEYSNTVLVFPVMDKKIIRYSSNAYLKAYQREYGQFPHIHRCPGVVTHRSIFEDLGCRYRVEAGHIADDDFFYRVGQFTDVVGLMTPLAAYREHGFSATGSLDELKLVRRLATDYLYQVRQWRDSSFPDKTDKKYFEYWALSYLFKALVGALKYSDHDLFLTTSTDFIKLMSEKLVCKHGLHLRRIFYLLAAEKIMGFNLCSVVIQKYANHS